MSEAFFHEVIAINSIYGEETLKLADVNEGGILSSNHDNDKTYILYLSHQDTWLRIYFPTEYPTLPPVVLGTYRAGPQIRKGDAARVRDAFSQALIRIYKPGEVCLYDIMEEMSKISQLMLAESRREPDLEFDPAPYSGPVSNLNVDQTKKLSSGLAPTPMLLNWSVSEVVTELKSVFVARSTRVTVMADVHRYRKNLLDQEKKVANATHNIMAWRIRGTGCISNYDSQTTTRCTSGSLSTTDQDYDDDGESAAGARLLHLMQLMDVWDVMVIVSRWYGGIHLGPRRFTIINSVARDALIKVGAVQQKSHKKKH